MTKLTSEEELTSEQKEKKKKKKKKKFNLLNEDYAHAHSRPSVSKGEKKERRTPSPYSDFVIDEKLLIQALDEINHKISNQQRLWMTL